MSRSVIAFDIGSKDIKIVQWNGHHVVQAVSVQTPENLVKEGKIVSYEVMADLIKESTREHHLAGRSCAVILPDSHAFLRRLTTPAMTVDQLAVNLPYEFRDFLTMEKDKYFYDYAVNELVKDEEGQPKELDLTACAVPKEVIEQYRAMFHRCGYKLITAIPLECAFSNLIQAQKEGEEQEWCFIDLGYSATRVYMFVGSRYETTRVIDMGTALLDHAVSDALGVDEHVAHTYVQTNHQNVHEMEDAQNLYQAIAMDIRKTVNFYGFDHRDSNLKNAWCFGGGVQIKPFVETIRSTLELELHDAAELLPADNVEAGNLASFAAAIGVAMQ